jgi:hypothetical protein
MALIEEFFNLHFLLANSVRFIPVKLSVTFRAVGESHSREAFELSPASSAIHPAKPPYVVNPAAHGNRLDVLDPADEFK